MSTKKTVALIVLVSIFAVGAISVWFVYKLIINPFRRIKEIPVELQQARIITGADFLSRSQLIKTNKLDSWKDVRDPTKLKGSLDSIEDIAVGELDGTAGLEIGIAGRYGALLIDRHGNAREYTPFEFELKTVELGPIKSQTEKQMLGDIQIVDLEADGVCEYLGRGSINGAAVFSHQGKVLWSYGDFIEGKGAIDDLTVGDVDGDRQAEFVVSWDGIELFDRAGTQKWKQEDGYSMQVEVVDVDGDGSNEILYLKGDELVIRDPQGEVIKTAKIPFYLGHFSLCQNPDVKAPPQILAYDNRGFHLIDFDGHVTSRLDAPLSKLKKSQPETIEVPGMDPTVLDTDEIYKTEAVWVKLVKDQPAYLAVLAWFAVMDRALFYVYDAQGKLVYQEVLPEQSSASLAVLPSEDASQPPSLLVGGEETVWQYTPR
jgi:hypothetical protein